MSEMWNQIKGYGVKRTRKGKGGEGSGVMGEMGMYPGGGQGKGKHREKAVPKIGEFNCWVVSY